MWFLGKIRSWKRHIVRVGSVREGMKHFGLGEQFARRHVFICLHLPPQQTFPIHHIAGPAHRNTCHHFSLILKPSNISMNPETPVSSGQATQRSTTSRESPTPESRQASSARPRHAACLSCRAKKLKCDGSRVCPNCARFNVNCVYDRVVRKTGPKKGYLRNLEERLRK